MLISISDCVLHGQISSLKMTTIRRSPECHSQSRFPKQAPLASLEHLQEWKIGGVTAQPRTTEMITWEEA